MGDVEMNHMIKHTSRLLYSASPRSGRESAPQLTDNHLNGLLHLRVLTRCCCARLGKSEDDGVIQMHHHFQEILGPF